MPLVKVVRSRGATTTVEANAEVLFQPTGSISRWENRLSNRVTEATRRAAPKNKRPHWLHYGKKLSDFGSFTSRTKRSGTRITTVLGSRVSHALYVDQGTGIYAGKSPWKAAILPPRAVGGSDLYESTWRPSKNSGPQGGRMIKGQRGQFFFAKGLRDALVSMRIPSVEVSDSAVAAKTQGGGVQAMVNSLGLPVNANGAFRQQLEEWRRWRDESFLNPDRVRVRSRALNPNVQRPRRLSPDERRERNRVNSQNYRDRIRRTNGAPVRKPKVAKPTKPKNTVAQRMEAAKRTERARFVGRLVMRYSAANGYDVRDIRFDGGRWTARVYRGGKLVKEFRGRDIG